MPLKTKQTQGFGKAAFYHTALRSINCYISGADSQCVLKALNILARLTQNYYSLFLRQGLAM
jgi:hypothetical protein